MKSPLLPHARRLPVVLALLAFSLLLSQTVAQVHAYSHLQPGATTSDFSGTAGQLCGECLASAVLLGSAGAFKSLQIFFARAVTVPVAVHAITGAEGPRYYAFRSRAPPTASV